MASSEKVLVIELNENPENQKLLDGKPQTCGMRSAGYIYPPARPVANIAQRVVRSCSSFSPDRAN